MRLEAAYSRWWQLTTKVLLKIIDNYRVHSVLPLQN